MIWGVGFALFFDAIAFVLDFVSVKLIASGAISVVYLLALAFTALGFLFTYLAVESVLGLNNPFPKLTIRPATPRVGETLEISWSFDRRSKVVQGLEISVEAKEEVSFRELSTYIGDADVDSGPTSGTAWVTRDQIIATLPAVKQAPLTHGSGSAHVQIPAGAMHSFESENAKLIWALRVKTAVAGKPDNNDELPFTVGPSRTPRGRPSQKCAPSPGESCVVPKRRAQSDSSSRCRHYPTRTRASCSRYAGRWSSSWTTRPSGGSSRSAPTGQPAQRIQPLT
jgi:hypothetical protein